MPFHRSNRAHEGHSNKDTGPLDTDDDAVRPAKEKSYLLTLTHKLGKLEGMLSQFLHIHDAMTQRIGDVERRSGEHDSRITALETSRSWSLGWVAGVGAVGGIIVTIATLGFEWWIRKG